MNNNILFYVLIFVPFTVLIFLDTRDLFNEKKKEDKKDKEKKEEGKDSQINNISEENKTQVPVQNSVQPQVTNQIEQNNNVIPVTNNNIENKEVKDETVENKE